MLKNSFYRTFGYRPFAYRSLVYRTLAAVALTSLLTAGCAEEHKKFAAPATMDWNKARLAIMYDVAEQQYKVGDYEKCKESLAKMLVVNAPYAPMHVLAAKVELEGGSLDNAVVQLKKAIEVDSSDPEPFYLLGVVYQRLQKFDAASDYYTQASQKKPDQAIYVLAAAEMKISLGELDDAQKFLEARIIYFDQSAAMRVALAKIATLKGDPVAAANDYRDATQLVPEDKNVRWSYAEALFDAEKYSDSAKILEDMRDDPPVAPRPLEPMTKGEEGATDEQATTAAKVNLLMTLGECYVNLSRPFDARDCFQQVIRLQPDNNSAYLSLGKTCLLTNDLNLTMAAAQKVLRDDTSNVPAMILEAAVEQKQKKWPAALSTLSSAVKVAPANETVLCMLGLSEIQLGQKTQAAAYLERAVAANPADNWAEELLAQVRPPAAQTPAAQPTSPAADADNPTSISTENAAAASVRNTLQAPAETPTPSPPENTASDRPAPRINPIDTITNALPPEAPAENTQNQ